MKKFLFVLMIAVSAFSFAPAAQGNETIEKLVLYLPNRVVDMFDLFSCSLGFGPKVQAELMATRMIGGGVSVGMSANLYKDCNRQYGWGLQNGWHWQIPGMMQEDTERVKTSRLVQSYWESFIGTPLPDQQIYGYYRGARDYWQIGGALGLLVCGELYLNPIEWVDFALGFFFVDIKDDDLTFENFQ